MPSADLFARNLRHFRKRRGLTQSQLAEQLFVSTQAVSKWERGESTPDISHIRALTALLQISADVLLGTHTNAQDALLAVDGGGTKTEFALISPAGQLLQHLVLGCSNPNNCGMEGSFQVLCQGIDQLLQSNYRILGLYIGCAGMSSGNNGSTMTALLKKQYPGIPLRCESDICNILACARDPGNAIAAICGTGCVVYATANGTLIRAGGGGWKLDPVGSGYELGRRALLAALEHRDGTGPETGLTAAVEQRLGGTVWAHIPALYAADASRIADFAPCVLQAWQTGDPVACAIVEENCRRLALLIEKTRSKSPHATQVLLTGGVVTNNAPYRQLLIRYLPEQLEVDCFRHPPVWGACLQCAKLCELPTPDIQNFMPQYELEVAKCSKQK